MNSNFEIIFIHLGAAKANHLWKNIKRIQSEWPEYRTVLIADSNEVIKRADVNGIKTWKYEADSLTQEIFHHSQHDEKFRSGFWNYSILRLFAATEYSMKYPDKALIHLESDIVPFSNFPFSELAKLKKPSWLKFNETHDVGSIFTIPNGESANELKSLFSELFVENPSLTDMTMLSLVAEQRPEILEYLPVIESSHSKYLRKGLSASDSAQKLAQNFEKFGGFFDSAPIGMWLLGQDPRNNFGKIVRYRQLSESFIQAQNISYVYDPDSNTLMTADGIPIFNLHVHSKESSYFLGKSAPFVKRVKFAQNQENESSFNITAFIALSIDYIKRNGIPMSPARIVKALKSLI